MYGPASVYDEFKLTDMNCNGKEESLEDCFYRLILFNVFGWVWYCWLLAVDETWTILKTTTAKYISHKTTFSGSVKAARGGRWQASLASQVSTSKRFLKSILNIVTKMADLKYSIVLNVFF